MFVVVMVVGVDVVVVVVVVVVEAATGFDAHAAADSTSGVRRGSADKSGGGVRFFMCRVCGGDAMLLPTDAGGTVGQ